MARREIFQSQHSSGINIELQISRHPRFVIGFSHRTEFSLPKFVSNLSLYSCRNTFFKASWQKGTLLLLQVCLLLLVNFTISSLLLGSEKNVAELKHHSMAKKWQLSGKMSQFLKRLYLPCLWCPMDALDYLMVEIWSFLFFYIVTNAYRYDN